ncbi:NAD-dependent epimerase/dehydratase family protein [Bacillus sp. FJAT-45350]|uniref:NAD-dependent epimerase/dehydratase family protein n=1 Tax=Bacillus sp. FJAT-45350 TaxID=2011014 RepID=UPI000BB91207|nr:NAD(P)-dependent oxidoreductase [Bacillus sp. FJAT-45350]
MKKVVVTGVLGFIGHQLCMSLLEEGYKVYGVDGVELAENKLAEHKLDLIGRNSNFKFINKKIEDVDFKNLLKGIDIVYHLAASTNSDNQWQNLRTTIEHNVRATQRIISACPKKTRFIYSSTVQVYGDRPGVITENAPTNPTTAYGLTKMTGESIILQEKKKKDMNVVILRLPTVYGPWQREDMTYYHLLKGTIEKTPVTDVCIDRTTLDVVYISDVVDAFLLAGTTKETNETYNITSRKKHQWHKGKQILTNFDYKPSINERLESSLSGEKAKERLGFVPKVSLEEGLKNQEEHMRKWIPLLKE